MKPGISEPTFPPVAILGVGWIWFFAVNSLIVLGYTMTGAMPAIKAPASFLGSLALIWISSAVYIHALRRRKMISVTFLIFATIAQVTLWTQLPLWGRYFDDHTSVLSIFILLTWVIAVPPTFLSILAQMRLRRERSLRPLVACDDLAAAGHH